MLVRMINQVINKPLQILTPFLLFSSMVARFVTPVGAANNPNSTVFTLVGATDAALPLPFMVGGDDTGTFAIENSEAMPAVGVLYRTSCIDTTCTAVGSNFTTFIDTSPLLYFRTNGKWAQPAIKNVTIGTLDITTCVKSINSKITCFAAGIYQDSNYEELFFPYVITSVDWNKKPVGTKNDYFGLVGDLNCANTNSSSICVMTGTYQYPNPTNQSAFVPYATVSTDADNFKIWSTTNFDNMSGQFFDTLSCMGSNTGSRIACVIAMSSCNYDAQERGCDLYNPSLMYGLISNSSFDLKAVKTRIGSGAYLSSSCYKNTCIAGGEYATNSNDTLAPMFDVSLNGGKNWFNQSVLNLPTTGGVLATQVIGDINICVITGTADSSSLAMNAVSDSSAPFIAASAPGCQTWSMKSFANMPQDGWLNAIAYFVTKAGVLVIASGAYVDANDDLVPLLVMSKDSTVNWQLISNANLPQSGAYEGASSVTSANNFNKAHSNRNAFFGFRKPATKLMGQQSLDNDNVTSSSSSGSAKQPTSKSWSTADTVVTALGATAITATSACLVALCCKKFRRNAATQQKTKEAISLDNHAAANSQAQQSMVYSRL